MDVRWFGYYRKTLLLGLCFLISGCSSPGETKLAEPPRPIRATEAQMTKEPSGGAPDTLGAGSSSAESSSAAVPTSQAKSSSGASHNSQSMMWGVGVLAAIGIAVVVGLSMQEKTPEPEVQTKNTHPNPVPECSETSPVGSDMDEAQKLLEAGGL